MSAILQWHMEAYQEAYMLRNRSTGQEIHICHGDSILAVHVLALLNESPVTSASVLAVTAPPYLCSQCEKNRPEFCRDCYDTMVTVAVEEAENKADEVTFPVDGMVFALIRKE